VRALLACLVASTLAHAEGPRLLDIAGHPVSYAAVARPVTVISFWATFCRPCIQELPSLQALANKLGPEVAVLAVSIDPEARHAAVQAVATAQKLTLPVLHDVDRALLARFFPKMAASGSVSVPQLVVVDARGRGFVESGFDPDEAVSEHAARLERVVARVRSGGRRPPDESWRRLGD
jgi:peroxiredoxin